jgi:hypothetical protein
LPGERLNAAVGGALGERSRRTPLLHAILQGCAKELVEHLRAKAVIADKGYDADTLCENVNRARSPYRYTKRTTRLRMHFSTRLARKTEQKPGSCAL